MNADERGCPGIKLLAVLAAGIVVASSITFPVLVYAWSFFVYPLYYYPFRHRSVVQEFPMRWEALPPSVVAGQRLQQPVWLRFEENPNFGIVIDGSQVGSLEVRRGVVSVLLSVHGDGRKGAAGFHVERVGVAEYGATRWSASYGMCPATPAGCGVDPLHRVICQGACIDSE